MSRSYFIVCAAVLFCMVIQGQLLNAQQTSVSRPQFAQPASNRQAIPEADGEIPWLRSATEAAQLSQATGKPILVYIRSQNCHYCDLLQKNTWQDPATRSRVVREMIPLKLTLEENKQAIEAMQVKGFPSVIIFSSDRQFLGRIDGYVSPQQFAGKMSSVLLAQQTSPATEIKR